MPSRIGTKAAPTLALCAGLWIAMWTGAANAVVDNISNLLDFEFGFLAGDADLAGTATIPINVDAKTVAGGAFDFGGTVISGKFGLRGPGGSSYDCILIPGSVITLSSGGNTINVDSLGTLFPLSGNLSSKGKRNIKMGGTLQVAAGQAAGNYTTTMTMDCGTVQATVDVTATLLAPISISSSGDMAFGTMLTTGTAGTVTVTPAGARSSVNVDLLGGFPAAAAFDVTGEGGNTYSITLPSSATLTSGGDTMTIDTFNHDAGGTPTLSGGSDTFNVGATLNVGATQA
ncbi:MAG: DUF4402 domain-containing protein, partial [Proteobacteria bacterium]|nr:DUF4402 domain-containing protein [Pseudomonadota bacterium]